MNLFPVVERELRVAARKPGTYWLRCLVAFLVLVLWLAVMGAQERHIPVSRLGPQLFTILNVLSLVYCLLAGVLLTADCISSEKRGGTLGLLFLTPLHGTDVVLGKLAATSVHAVFGLLTIVPIQALSLLLGGITGGEVTRVVLVLVATLFFSLAMGMLASTLCQEVRAAVGSAFLFVLFPTALLPAAGGIWASLHPYQPANRLFFVASPGFSLMNAYDGFYRNPVGSTWFWRSCLLIIGLAIGGLIVACVLLPRYRQERSSPTTSRGWGAWWRQCRFGHALTRERLRHKLITANPFYWLSVRDRWPGKMALGLFGGTFVFWMILLLLLVMAPANRFDDIFAVCILSLLGLHQFYKAMVVTESSRLLSDSYHNGALELLLTTPLSVAAVLQGQWQALRQHFYKPMLMLTLMNLSMVWALVSHSDRWRIGRETGVFCVIFIGGALALWFDTWALKWTGMEAALRTPHHHRAMISAWGRIMALPWVGLGVVFLAMASNRVNRTEEVTIFFGTWFVLSFIYSTLMGSYARTQLYSRFRRLVARC